MSHWYFSAAFLVAYFPVRSSSVDFQSCLTSLKNGSFGDIGLDNRGHSIANMAASAISYSDCIENCGAGQEPFDWSIFSQQFGSWLLPWLALVSQLPFGANDRLANLESMLLTVGSPTLAAYSLTLTVLNGRWVARRFAALPYLYPNAGNIVRVLAAFQQFPLKVTTEHGLLASLIVLPQNNQWWNEMIEWLDCNYSWSIAAAISIAWVVIAYIFTVIDSFAPGDITIFMTTNGQAVGSLWLWLLPIVVGWLQLSHKCDSNQYGKTMKRANAMAYVANEHGYAPVHASELHSNERAIDLLNLIDDHVRADEQCAAPIYNYARFLPWVQSVERVYDSYRAVSERAFMCKPVDPSRKWVPAKLKDGLDDNNRMGSKSQVIAYCRLDSSNMQKGPWGHEVIERMLIASVSALFLQWGTTGAAIIAAWFTPTYGLGCRSVSYIVYAALSTIVWMLLLASSILSGYTTLETRHLRRHKFSPIFRAAKLSILLRRTGKLIASINAVWIVVSCLFQFTRFFDRCYCNSSMFGLGKAAYVIIQVTADEIASTKAAWLGGVGLASGTAIIFMGFIFILLNPAPPDRA